MENFKNDLSYSIQALRVKALFYGKRAMVYVEGEDDLNFWEPYFDKSIFQIEDVGGSSNLNQYIEKLENGENSFIVACDSDYTVFKNNKYFSNLIVTTYGHSIENMMYCPYKLNELIKKISKSLTDSTELIELWYDKFVKTAHPLLLREICNAIYKPKEDKIQVFGNNCARFCKLNPCFELDENKIADFCNKNKEYFSDEVLMKIEKTISKDGRDERQLIKGHFLTYAVNHLVTYISAVNSYGKKKPLSNDILYALTIHCEECKKDQCVEKQHILNSVSLAVMNVEIL